MKAELASHAGRPALVIVGGGSGHRAQSLTAACLAEFGHRPRTLTWRDVLRDPHHLDTALEGADWLRFETPDQDADELAALHEAGADEAVRLGIHTMPADSKALIASGAIGSPSQMNLGLHKLVAMACALADTKGVTTSTRPEDVALAFDKRHAQAQFRAAGLPVPRSLEGVTDFASLETAMDQARINRVFVKLRHGAAAAGMVALARHGQNWRSATTAEIGADGVLRATRRVRTLNTRAEAERLINTLGPLGLHAEAWIPKIGIQGRAADVRLVMIGGDVASVTVRASLHPMTNLHLGGERLPLDALTAVIGDAMWDAICETARKVARLFPHSDNLGIDIAISADARRHYVLEANLFGDFVKDAGSDASHLHALAMRHIRHKIAARCMDRHAA